VEPCEAYQLNLIIKHKSFVVNEFFENFARKLWKIFIFIENVVKYRI